MIKKTVVTFIIVAVSIVAVILSYIKIKSLLDKNVKYFLTRELPKTGAPIKMKDYRLKETDGMKLTWMLDADMAEIYNTKNIIQFFGIKTRVNTNDLKGTYYDISASKGVYYTDTSKIVMNGDVSIDTSNGYTFSTDAVLYDAKTKNVNTDFKVTAFGPKKSKEPIFVEGVGLLGDINKGIFSISKDVKTVRKSMETSFGVKSESAVFNTKKDAVFFAGNVRAEKGNMDIKGESLDLKYKDSGEMDTMVVQENVIIDIPENADNHKVAYCQKAVIGEEPDQIVLSGKPRLHLNEDIITGKRITFFTNNDEVSVEGVRAEVSEEGVQK